MACSSLLRLTEHIDYIVNVQYSLKSIPMYSYFIINDIPGISVTILLFEDMTYLILQTIGGSDYVMSRQQLELFSVQLSNVEKFIITARQQTLQAAIDALCFEWVKVMTAETRSFALAKSFLQKWFCNSLLF